MKKKVALIIASQNFRDEEYSQPKNVLENAGIEVTTVSSKTGFIRGKLGMLAQATIKINDLKTGDFDAIVFIGGPGSSEYFSNPTAHKIAKESKVIGAICAASNILANAGILKGKKATVHPDPEYIENLEKHGAEYTAEDVEIDGNIITADGPESATVFGKEILRLIQ